MSAKPLIESAVAGLTGSPPFVALFEDGVRRVHGALLSGDDSRLRLDLRDMGVLVQSALGHLPISGVDRIQADVAPAADGRQLASPRPRRRSRTACACSRSC